MALQLNLRQQHFSDSLLARKDTRHSNASPRDVASTNDAATAELLVFSDCTFIGAPSSATNAKQEITRVPPGQIVTARRSGIAYTSSRTVPITLTVVGPTRDPSARTPEMANSFEYAPTGSLRIGLTNTVHLLALMCSLVTSSAVSSQSSKSSLQSGGASTMSSFLELLGKFQTVELLNLNG
jgi:hypothetical protein